VPRIRLLRGERNREFVLSHKMEYRYLKAAPQPLRDIALLILDTGLRPGEAVRIRWPYVHLAPLANAKSGYIQVPGGKSKNAKRNLSLTLRVSKMLKARQAVAESLWAFPSENGSHFLVTSIDHQHEELRKTLKLPQEFVPHSLRHTFGTRLGESETEAFTIMKIMGHSSVTVSQRYVQPTPESMERAFERLETLNKRERHAGKPRQGYRDRGVPIISTTAKRKRGNKSLQVTETKA
jgi:integrase